MRTVLYAAFYPSAVVSFYAAVTSGQWLAVGWIVSAVAFSIACRTRRDEEADR